MLSFCIEDGTLQLDNQRLPNAFPVFGDYLHSLALKFDVYTRTLVLKHVVIFLISYLEN